MWGHLSRFSIACLAIVSACDQGGPTAPSGPITKTDFITCVEPENVHQVVPTAADVLLASQRAHAKLESLVGTVTVEDVANYANRSFSERRTLKVFFQRPAQIRVEGSVPRSGKFTIVSKGKATRVIGFGLDGSRPSLRYALAEFSGVSLHSSLMIPGVLMDLEWQRDTLFLPYGSLLPAFATNAELAGEERIGNSECYRLVCRRQIGTWTFYIDKENHLIRRIVEEADEEQMQVQRQAGGGGYGGIKSIRLVQSFEFESLDAPLDAALFTSGELK
jgi:hypothetical protein